MSTLKAQSTLARVGLITLISGSALAGPDILVSQINGATNYGVVGEYQAFSFGDITCNIGDMPFTYVSNTNHHPVFASTIYRIQDGRFEQIGIGFVAHTFFPLQSNSCDFGCNPGATGMLGDGCSDAVGASIAGIQSDLAPRIEIDPYTGEFPYPFTTINQSGNAIYKRVKVNTAEISDPGALYFVETQYISKEETTDATRNNSASYRRVVFSPGTQTPVFTGDTFAGQPAIYAWKAQYPDVVISEAQVPNNGIIQVGSKATQLLDGSWRYDYAVHNQNSSRGVESLRVDTGAENDPSAIGFHDIDYLDAPDSDIDQTSWSVVDGEDFLIWQRNFQPTAMFDNLIRWGTTYSFSCISTAPPTTGTVQIGIASLGEGDSSDILTLQAVHPQDTQSVCLADLNNDGELNFFDVSAFLSAFAQQDPAADFTGDLQFDFFDVSAFLSAFSAGCP